MSEQRPEEKPTYNLKVVVRETGLKPDTLRVWERRYGLPQPERTAGGHRLYSQRDIDTLKWLVARQEEGMSISHAVKLWRDLETEGQNPFQSSFVSAIKPEPLVQTNGSALSNLRRAWLLACMAFDQTEADHILNQAFAIYSVETVCAELLQVSIAEIGDEWYKGNVSVQQEHFASALIVRRLEVLLSASPPPSRSKRILIGCPPGEEHTLSPLILTLFLRRRGWEVIYLGARIPINRFQATVAKIKPDLAILIAQLLPTAASLLDIAPFLQAERVPMAFGGAIFSRLPKLALQIPGHFLGPHLIEAPQIIEGWLSSSTGLVSYIETPTVAQQYIVALEHFTHYQGALESYLWQIAPPINILPSHLAEANRYLANIFRSALRLGDFNFLSAEIDWIHEMLSYQQMPLQMLMLYLQAYHEAAKNTLDAPGEIIVSWLEALVQQAEVLLPHRI